MAVQVLVLRCDIETHAQSDLAQALTQGGRSGEWWVQHCETYSGTYSNTVTNTAHNEPDSDTHSHAATQ